MNLAGSLLITLLLVAFLAIYPALVGYLGKRWFYHSKPAFLLLGMPALWVLGEWCRSRLFTGFPWLNFGYSQIDSPLAGLAPITGVYGVTWVTILSSGLVIMIYHAAGKYKLLSFISLIIIWGGTGQIYLKDWTEVSGNISTALIQGAIPQKLKWKPELREKSFNLYLDLTRPYLNSDLIIWPETAIPALYHQVPDLTARLQELTGAGGGSLITGIPVRDQDTGNIYNSAVLFDGSTVVYHKRHLVPFGEYLPLRFLLHPVFRFLKIPVSDFTPGTQSKPLLPGTDFDTGISICYEDTFGEEVIESLPEAGILVNISNDAWFGDSLAPHQHLQMARMRAKESGRYLLRATNTGITAIIDEMGWISSRSEQFKPVALTGKVLLFTGSTPYAKTGNIPVLMLALIILGVTAIKSKNGKSGIR